MRVMPKSPAFSFFSLPRLLVDALARIDPNEPLIDLIGIVSINITLAHKRESNAMIKLAKAGNFIVCSRFLTTKLIRREPKNDESTVCIFLV